MQQYSAKNWTALIFLSAIWGCSFLFMKKGLLSLSWDQVAAMRISFSCLATLPILLLHRKKIKKAEIKYYMMTGFFGSGLPAFCFTYAETHIASGITGVLNSMTPVFTFIVGVLFFSMQFVWRKVLGLVIALGGSLMLILFDTTESGQSNILFALPVFLATISYAISANIVKRHLQNAHPLVMGAVGFLIIGIPAISYLCSTAFWHQSADPNFILSIGSVFLLSILGTVMASIIFYALIQQTDSIFGSLVAYLIPVFAIILGMLDGEKLRTYHFAGMACILIGIYILNAPKSKKGRQLAVK